MHKIIYIFITIIILGCSADIENPDNSQFCSDESKVYLDDNGITIKAENCYLRGYLYGLTEKEFNEIKKKASR